MNSNINLSGKSDGQGLLKWISTIFNMVMAKKQYKLSEQANTANIEAQKRANDTNIMLTRETNAQQMELAEKEYQRSLPTTQVANYMNAGMSRAGAIGALSGAGSYSAPSLNTAQVNAEQSDVSGQTAALEQMVGIAANAMQMRQEAKLAREQMRNAKEIAHIQAESAQNVAEINKTSHAYGSELTYQGQVYSSDMQYKGQELVSRRQMETALENIGLGYAKLQEVQRQYDDMSLYNKRKFNAEIQHLNTQSNLDNERKKEIADKLAEWNSSTEKDARAAVSLMQTYLGYHTYYETELKIQKFLKHTEAQVYWKDNGVGGVVPQIRYPRDFINKRDFWESEVGQFWGDANRTINSELLSEIMSVVLLKK